MFPTSADSQSVGYSVTMATQELIAFGIKSHFSWNVFYFLTLFVVPELLMLK